MQNDSEIFSYNDAEKLVDEIFNAYINYEEIEKIQNGEAKLYDIANDMNPIAWMRIGQLILKEIKIHRREICVQKNIIFKNDDSERDFCEKMLTVTGEIQKNYDKKISEGLKAYDKASEYSKNDVGWKNHMEREKLIFLYVCGYYKQCKEICDKSDFLTYDKNLWERYLHGDHS